MLNDFYKQWGSSAQHANCAPIVINVRFYHRMAGFNLIKTK